MLINNAGIMPIGPFVDEDDATARRMIDINVHGVLFGMKLAMPGDGPRGSGHIVNIASAAGKGGFPAAPPTRRPSTPWSGSARRFGPSFATPGSRSRS